MRMSPAPESRPTTLASQLARNCIMLLCLLAFSQLRAQTPDEITRLNQQIAPIASVRAGSGFADLAPLAAVVAPARVVALGESTHGSHEVFQLKHRLLEYLVTQQGFTTFAIEADYGYGEILNEYIQTGTGDSLLVRKAAGDAVWDTAEFWEMVEWMRAYNQQHAVKIRYAGFDMQRPLPNLLRLESFATQRGDTVLRRLVQSVHTSYSALSKAPDQTSAAIKEPVVRQANELAHYLQAVAAPAAMQQHALVLLQRAELVGDKHYGDGRDQAMATNVAWLLKQEPAAKIVLWAHNAHIRRDDYQPQMGHHLARRLGPAYVAVGFATGHGTASVLNSDGSTRTQALTLTPPISNSYEALLDQATPPIYFLNLSQAGAATKWLTTGRKFRAIGLYESPRGAEGQFLWYAPLPKAFDALLYLHDTSASQINPAVGFSSQLGKESR